MRQKYDLTIIIPAYNEEKKIERDIREAYKFMKAEQLSGEVIVSTDGVTDKTNRIVKSLMHEFPTLKLLSKKQKIGKGMAIKSAVMKAAGEYMMFADAGLCIPFSFANTGLRKLKQGSDIAIASRAIKQSKIERQQPFYRKIGSKIFGYIVRVFLGIPQEIKDTQCGFKLYKNTPGSILFGELQSKTFMFDIEILLRAKKHHFIISQFPVEWTNDEDSKFKPLSGSITNIKELLTMKLIYRL